MRFENSLKNIISGIGGQFLYTVLKLISRYFFIIALGKEFLGINGLFTNIITILSISELGFGNAIVFSLYKPIANNDYKKINILMSLYKKAYAVIGTVIFILGLFLLPFLKYLVNFGTRENIINIYFVYLLFLFDTVSSYWFFEYKKSFVYANQKNYIVNLYEYLYKIIFTILQIASILCLQIFNNSIRFYIYTILGIVGNLIAKWSIKRYSDKHYSYQKTISKEKLKKEEKTELLKNVTALSVYKICSKVLTSSDNIIISALLTNGTIIVGVYSNYILATSTIAQFTQQIIKGFAASIGNFYATESKDKNEFIFRCLDLINFWMYGFASICLWILLNPFIRLLFGNSFVLPNFTLFLIVFNFLTLYQTMPANSFRNASGLYWKGKLRPVADVVLNLVISLALVKPFGINGVLIGTAISNLLTVYWFEPWLVYKHAFNKSSKTYFLRLIINNLIIFVVGTILYYVFIPLSASTWSNFLIKAIITVLVTNIVFLLFKFSTQEFIYCKSKFISIFRRKIRK